MEGVVDDPLERLPADEQHHEGGALQPADEARLPRLPIVEAVLIQEDLGGLGRHLPRQVGVLDGGRQLFGQRRVQRDAVGEEHAWEPRAARKGVRRRPNILRVHLSRPTHICFRNIRVDQVVYAHVWSQCSH